MKLDMTCKWCKSKNVIWVAKTGYYVGLDFKELETCACRDCGKITMEAEE